MNSAGSDGIGDLLVVTARGLRTIVRVPAIVTSSVVFGLAVVAVAAAGSGARGGCVPLVLDLVPFVKALASLLAVILCYRAVFSDRESGELDILRTFDVSHPAYAGGVYLGQGLTFVPVVFESLFAAGATVPVLSPSSPAFLTLNEAVDSSVALPRFSVLAVLLALAVAAVMFVVSTAAWIAQQAAALVAGLLVTFVVGVGAVAVVGLASRNLGIDAIPLVFVTSLDGAFRSLTLSTTIEASEGGSSTTALAGLVS